MFAAIMTGHGGSAQPMGACVEGYVKKYNSTLGGDKPKYVIK